MEFKASLDKTSKIITACVTLLFLWMVGQNFWNVKAEAGILLIVFTSVFPMAIYLFCYMYKPIKYVVDGNGVTIKRPFTDRVLDFRSIKNTFIATNDSMKGTMRTFGNGGLFGYTGKFSNHKFGSMTWYATRREHYLIIKTIDEETIVLTPDDTTMAVEIKRQINK